MQSVIQGVDPLVQDSEFLDKLLEGRRLFVNHGFLHGPVVFLPGIADFCGRDDVERLRKQGLVCDGCVSYLADIVDVAGHAVYTDVGLRLGKLLVKEEEFLQESVPSARNVVIVLNPVVQSVLYLLCAV